MNFLSPSRVFEGQVSNELWSSFDSWTQIWTASTNVRRSNESSISVSIWLLPYKLFLSVQIKCTRCTGSGLLVFFYSFKSICLFFGKFWCCLFSSDIRELCTTGCSIVPWDLKHDFFLLCVYTHSVCFCFGCVYLPLFVLNLWQASWMDDLLWATLWECLYFTLLNIFLTNLLCEIHDIKKKKVNKRWKSA